MEEFANKSEYISKDAEPDRQSGIEDTNFTTMTPETEDMYNRLIRKSVDSGDIDKAWRLVREAEKIGSVTVRRTFIRALERQK